ncbi:MAG TPA: hypothetical protein VFZ34_06640 [Blastocatellia bacterium]|nr:hypothetical protein [Blastocatellia bacterium]
MTPNITVRYPPGARELSAKLFGQIVPDIDLAQAIGALEGAVVTVEVERGHLVATVTHDWVEVQVRSIFRDLTGALVICNRAIRKSPSAPTGFGIRQFLTQVAAARKLGIVKITTYAAGYPTDPARLNGYYTWVRFGFDAPLDDADFEELPEAYASAITLNDLMKLGGHEWWRENGAERELTFELDENCSMMQVLNEYIAHLQKAGRL